MLKFKLFAFLILTVLVSTCEVSYARDVDSNDNKAPSLVSISLDKSNFVEGDIATLTLVVRDDKNELANIPYVLIVGPQDAPGSISKGFFPDVVPPLVVADINGYIETTIKYSFMAPAWAGDYRAFNIQGLSDKMGNSVGIDVAKCQNKDIYINQQVMAFPNLIPVCNMNFKVRLLTQAEKDAAANAAAEKAAAEIKVQYEAAFGTLRNIQTNAITWFVKYPEVWKTNLELRDSLQRAIDYKYSPDPNQNDLNVIRDLLGGTLVTRGLVPDFTKAQLEITKFVQVKAIAAKSTNPKSIMCVKGKLTKKVTGINPKCPSGYRKK